MKKLVLFASGSGSNVERIAHYFEADPMVLVAAVLTNKRNAPVLDRCDRLGLSAFYFNRTAFYDSDRVLEFLRCVDPDLIILAGFLWKVPKNIVDAFQGKVVNIHPALLPLYGGKGMYGMRVHEAVKAAGDDKTGITIHYVNEAYDKGAVIVQVPVAVAPDDTPEAIAEKVHTLEYEYYPKTIAQLLENR